MTAALLVDLLQLFLDNKPLPEELGQGGSSSHLVEQSISQLKALISTQPMRRGGDSGSDATLRSIFELCMGVVKEQNNLHACDADGRNLLFLACEWRRLDLVKHLLTECKFGINETDQNYGWTPLHMTVSVGDIGLVRYLLDEAKADPNKLTNMGVSTAYEAAFARDDTGATIIKELLKAGLDRNKLNQTSKDELTPLLVACWRDNLKTARFLLENGADLNYKTSSEQTAFDLAVLAGSVGIARLLVARGWTCSEGEGASDLFDQDENYEERWQLHRAARKGWTDTFAALFRYADAVKVNTSYPPYERTILHQAADNGHLAIVQLICEHKDVDVLVKDKHGRKPSDLVRKQRSDIRNLLLEKEKQHLSRRSAGSV